jgi:carbonic anhydrase/acetyltransferase-like protein (isoleucine patch superfamily)
MLLSHLGHQPQVDPSAYVAPTATVCGDVTIGPDCRIMHGASLVAEGGSVAIDACCVILENAVIRSTGRHSTHIGAHCLIGPNAHLVGCTLEREVFIATGAAVFHGAHLGQRCEVRVNAIVHLQSRLAAGTTVPIGWVAVGEPTQLFSPDRHDEIWTVQAPLNFPRVVYGIDRRDADMVKITTRMSEALTSHRGDVPVPEE